MTIDLDELKTQILFAVDRAHYRNRAKNGLSDEVKQTMDAFFVQDIDQVQSATTVADLLAFVPRYPAEVMAYQGTPKSLEAQVQEALLKIDADTDLLYGAVLGNRAQEYTLAEQEAAQYQAAGYTGAVPASVQSWAIAKSWSPVEAADSILATAAQWRSAQAAIRAQRLLCKEQVRVAEDATSIGSVLATWAGFVAYMKTQLEAA